MMKRCREPLNPTVLPLSPHFQRGKNAEEERLPARRMSAARNIHEFRDVTQFIQLEHRITQLGRLFL
jgi:hypothetical protein